MNTLRILRIDFHIIHTRTRFPFHYGIASMNEVPHLFLRAELEIDGQPAIGISADGLPPKWFTKVAEDTPEEELSGILESITHAARTAEIIATQDSLFDFWKELYHQQIEWAHQNDIAPLLAQFGVSLIERAMIDAFCRAKDTTFAQALAQNRFGIRLDQLHPELDSRSPADYLPAPNSQAATLITRHTIGLSDPIRASDISEAARADDGLPQALEDCIQTYWVNWFKIKLCGDLQTDLERMAALAELFAQQVPTYHFTLDGNEQFKTIEAFHAYWDQCLADPRLDDFFSPAHLLFVEQPLHRDQALADHVAADLTSWSESPPLIIDESDSSLQSCARALKLGYAGTSHKNCKGIFKSIANACLLKHRAQHDPTAALPILSGEDLVNIGPVALLQDLTVMHALGIKHVERNGHHYMRGLSAFPQEVQAQTLQDHADLYQTDQENIPCVHIKGGKVNIQSLLDAPFGTAFRIDQVMPDWTWLSVNEIKVSHLLNGSV
ncbi:MAG: hypothetical protein L3J39_00475 [Verrucomicrobiales bacterium]|nr:hypothetical protein [Verrucomicrobiales bacterium]